MVSSSIQLIDKDRNVALVDNLTKNLVTLDSVHHRVHKGQMFQADRMAQGVANNATVEILLTVPVNSGGHVAFSAKAGGNAMLELFEAPTVTANGTALVTPNRSHRSSVVPDILAFHTPTVSADGTRLSHILVPGGSGGNSAGGSSDSFAEWLLDEDEVYYARLTNISGVAQPLGLEIDWYEPGQLDVNPTG